MTNPLDVNFIECATLGNELLSRLNAIRETDPVFWSDAQQGWIITRHADVAAGFMAKVPLSAGRLQHLQFNSVPREEWATRLPLLTGTVPQWLINVDPPAHTRLRRLTAKAFGRKVIESIRPFAQQRIEQLLKQGGDLREFDFIDTIARPLTGSVIMKLLGVPPERLSNLRDWAFAVGTALGAASPTPAVLDEGERALREMDAVFASELQKRSAAPSDDFLSALVSEAEGEDKLTREELLGICVVTLLAGHDTTLSSMTLGTAALVENPSQIQYMLNHPERTGESVMEIARYIAMSTCQTRLASEDFEWHGKNIKSGDTIYLMIAGANRDARVFGDPERLDLARDNNDQSYVFAPGVHHCIGHLLAKMQLGEFFPRCFDRFTVDILEDSLPFAPSYTFRGLERMQVRFTPRPT